MTSRRNFNGTPNEKIRNRGAVYRRSNGLNRGEEVSGVPFLPGKCQLLDSQFRLHCTRNMTAICVGLPPLPGTATPTFHSTKTDFAKKYTSAARAFLCRQPLSTLHVTLSISFREFAWFDACSEQLRTDDVTDQHGKFSDRYCTKFTFNYFNLYISRVFTTDGASIGNLLSITSTFRALFAE